MDRNTRLVWLGTGIAVGVVWIVGLRYGQRAPGAREPAVDAARMQESAAAPQPDPGPDPGPDPDPDPDPGPDPDPDPDPVQPAQAVVDVHPKSPGQVLPGAFLREPPDPAWAPQAEETIRTAFADAQVPEGSLLSVECRQRLCRAEIWFETRHHQSFGKAYATLREHFGLDMGFERVRGGIRGEPEQVAVYLPRKGYVLQDFERAPR